MLRQLKDNDGTFVINCIWKTQKEIEENFPKSVLRELALKKVKL